jgi:hypothetical protein
VVAWGSTSGVFQASASKEHVTSLGKDTATEADYSCKCYAIEYGEKS